VAGPGTGGRYGTAVWDETRNESRYQVWQEESLVLQRENGAVVVEAHQVSLERKEAEQEEVQRLRSRLFLSSEV
jgi:hypothetical protein